MKKLLQIATLLCLMLIISCNKDQKLIGDVEGEYNVETVINYKNGRRNPATFTGGRIYFEDCKMKDGTGGNCNGWYVFDGNDTVTFQYHTKREKGAKIIAITNLSGFAEPKITGTFKFQLLSSYLLLNGIEESGSVDGTTVKWYSDIRLSK